MPYNPQAKLTNARMNPNSQLQFPQQVINFVSPFPTIDTPTNGHYDLVWDVGLSSDEELLVLLDLQHADGFYVQMESLPAMPFFSGILLRENTPVLDLNTPSISKNPNILDLRDFFEHHSKWAKSKDIAEDFIEAQSSMFRKAISPIVKPNCEENELLMMKLHRIISASLLSVPSSSLEGRPLVQFP